MVAEREPPDYAHSFLRKAAYRGCPGNHPHTPRERRVAGGLLHTSDLQSWASHPVVPAAPLRGSLPHGLISLPPPGAFHRCFVSGNRGHTVIHAISNCAVRPRPPSPPRPAQTAAETRWNTARRGSHAAAPPHPAPPDSQNTPAPSPPGTAAASAPHRQNAAWAPPPPAGCACRCASFRSPHTRSAAPRDAPGRSAAWAARSPRGRRRSGTAPASISA